MESTEWRQACFARLGKTVETTANIKERQIHEIAELKKTLRKIVEKLNVLTCRPAAPAGGAIAVTTPRGTLICQGDPEQGQGEQPTTPAPNLKTFGDLWREHMSGIGGRMPAGLFTHAQQG